MLTAALGLLAEPIPAPPEPVQQTVWEIVLQGMGAAMLVVAFLGLLWRFALKHHVDNYIEKFTEVYRTTTVNGGKNDPPTLLDEISRNTQAISELGDAVEHMREQQDSTIAAVGAIAVNQANLSERFDEHLGNNGDTDDEDQS